jgi:isopentenyl-diphosphate delta-isomerase
MPSPEIAMNPPSPKTSQTEDDVILVDTSDNVLATMPKLEAHRKGLLHRAVSGFLFNADGDLLIQRRAMGKYHSGGLWANTCCSHPRPGETPSDCMDRRFGEELGIVAETREFATFVYKVPVEPDLTEHEFVHAFSGLFEGAITPNPLEVMDHAWVSLAQLDRMLHQNVQMLCPWFYRYLIAGYVSSAVENVIGRQALSR